LIAKIHATRPIDPGRQVIVVGYYLQSEPLVRFEGGPGDKRRSVRFSGVPDASRQWGVWLRVRVQDLCLIPFRRYPTVTRKRIPSAKIHATIATVVHSGFGSEMKVLVVATFAE
jgi:hypothetical protein